MALSTQSTSADWSLVNSTSSVNSSTPPSAVDNYTATYETSLLQADLIAIFGQASFDFVTSYSYIYGLVFPVIAAFGVIADLIIAALFWFVHRFRSHDTGSMASLFVGAHLVADALFLVCFVLSTTPAAVVSQRLVAPMYRLRGSLPNGSDTEWAFEKTMAAAMTSGEILSSISATQMLFMRTRYRPINASCVD